MFNFVLRRNSSKQFLEKMDYFCLANNIETIKSMIHILSYFCRRNSTKQK